MRGKIMIGSCGLLMGLWLVVFTVGAPAPPTRVVAAVRETTTSATPTPPGSATVEPPAALRLDVHVEASANGEGSAHVVASSQGGQALAHIDTKGQASGKAQADAPAQSGCIACGGALPLDSGDQKTEDRGRPSAEGTRAEAVATPLSGQVVILVEANLRSGPSLGSSVIGGAHAGERYAVTGRSADQAWWRVCCAGNGPAWLYAALAQWVDPPVPLSALVTPSGPLGSFAAPSLPLSALVTPTVMPTPTPTPAFTIVEQEQHYEANYATIYAWVQDGQGVSLEGYTLQVTKDGAPLAVGAVRSTAYRQGTTRPSAAGGPEDKPYNLKLAFNPQVVGVGFTPAGAWAVQLLDPQGQPAAVGALFALRNDDDHREMYLNYARR